MKKVFQLGVFSLLLLAALSISDAGEAFAQKKSSKSEKKEYKDKKGGPPDWAPAHGYRRKGGEQEVAKDDKWKDSDKKRDWKNKEKELKHREKELDKREEALKDREKSSSKKRPTDILNKRGEQEGGENKESGTEPRTIPEKIEEIKRRKRENTKQSSGSILERWTAGTGW